ncbi:hypothetical protein AAGC94_04090 [Clostridium sporogenes]|uniref:DUF2651 domain-containing protein n=2 Tax=Clostridium TaxID=1485 RepID=A0A7X5P980_CLOSG|nr:MULTISPECIES: hypothetical protein [Clostridium]AJD32875.1 putative membrane protein [Clostridium botulinum Prevot_594]AVP61955.1 hypothetical protein C7M79_15175 [Clostridium botulinum]AKC62752.1 hypothetical protein CLSPO_c20320 [Clostridium sporogenes]AKJ90005.1 hypothetical protein CLSPOx_10225 [Clostridium sporogenes]AVP65188.1 hypothetical protein C3B64_13360 [Clostridium botulinum]
MEKRKIITITFPTLFMTIITIVSFQNMLNFNGIDFKGIFIISLILLFPILFLIQGILCAINNTNIFLSLGVSILDFIILMFVYMNESAFIYNLIYLIVGIIAYFITKSIKKTLSSKNY